MGVGKKKHGGEGRLTQNLASPCLQGEGDHVSTSNLASPLLAEARDHVPKPLPPPLLAEARDHEVVEGVAPSGRCLQKRA